MAARQANKHLVSRPLDMGHERETSKREGSCVLFRGTEIKILSSARALRRRNDSAEAHSLDVARRPARRTLRAERIERRRPSPGGPTAAHTLSCTGHECRSDAGAPTVQASGRDYPCTSERIKCLRNCQVSVAPMPSALRHAGSCPAEESLPRATSRSKLVAADALATPAAEVRS